MRRRGHWSARCDSRICRFARTIRLRRRPSAPPITMIQKQQRPISRFNFVLFTVFLVFDSGDDDKWIGWQIPEHHWEAQDAYNVGNVCCPVCSCAHPCDTCWGVLLPGFRLVRHSHERHYHCKHRGGLSLLCLRSQKALRQRGDDARPTEALHSVPVDGHVVRGDPGRHDDHLRLANPRLQATSIFERWKFPNLGHHPRLVPRLRLHRTRPYHRSCRNLQESSQS